MSGEVERKAKLSTFWLVMLAVVCWSGLGLGPVSEVRGQEKYALMIAVTRYNHAEMNKPQLKFPEDDARALGQFFQNSGYQVDYLLGKEATRKAILAALDNLKNKGGSGGVVVVGLFGHGVEALFDLPAEAAGAGNAAAAKRQTVEGCFCPWDTGIQQAMRDGQLLFNAQEQPMIEPVASTLVRMREVLGKLSLAAASSRVVFADCCREMPNRARSRNLGLGANFQAKDLPDNAAVMFGCAPGGVCFERDDWKHGAFTKCLLEELTAMRGSGAVTTGTLGDRVKESVRTLTGGPNPQDPQPFQTNSLNLQLVSARPAPAPLPLQRPSLLRAPFTSSKAQELQQAWSDYLKKPVVKEDPDTGVILTLIPPGEFTMGSSPAERDRMLRLYPDTKPEWIAGEVAHPVRLTAPFYLGSHELTVGQFRKFVVATGYRTDAERDGEGGYGWNEAAGEFQGRKPQYTWRNTGFTQTDDHPVVNISWNDADAYCKWFSTKTGLTCRLPTEAEWEYACRAGTTTAFWNDDDVEKLTDVANIADATAKEKWTRYTNFTYQRGRDGFVFSAPVGSFRANAFGLFDMHGNVFEWCRDWYDESFYSRAPEENPENTTIGEYRVLRGGSWSNNARDSRSAYRSRGAPTNRDGNIGLRVVCELR